MSLAGRSRTRKFSSRDERERRTKVSFSRAPSFRRPRVRIDAPKSVHAVSVERRRRDWRRPHSRRIYGIARRHAATPPPRAFTFAQNPPDAPISFTFIPRSTPFYSATSKFKFFVNFSKLHLFCTAPYINNYCLM